MRPRSNLKLKENPAMAKPRVLLADDHQLILHALKNILDPEFDVVGAVTNGAELVPKAEELRPEVLVVDICMPLLGGIEAVKQLRKKLGDVKVVFLTMHSDIVFAAKAFEAGAKGYVLKQAAPVELLMAVREAVQGRTFVSPATAGQLMEYYRSGPEERSRMPGINLTSRQLQLIQFLAEGQSVKEISALMNISPRTVESHKYRLMQQLKLKNTAELVAFAMKHHLISGSGE